MAVSNPNPKREPRGIPSGGQYAADVRPEGSTASLSANLPNLEKALEGMDDVELSYAAKYGAPYAKHDAVKGYVRENVTTDGTTRAAGLRALREQTDARALDRYSAEPFVSSYDLHDEQPDHPDALTDDVRMAIYAAATEGMGANRSQRIDEVHAIGTAIDDGERHPDDETPYDDEAEDFYTENHPDEVYFSGYERRQKSLRELYDRRLADLCFDAAAARAAAARRSGDQAGRNSTT